MTKAVNMKNMKELEQRIAVVQEKRDLQWLEIKATAELLSESVKPKNLVKQILDEKFGEKDIYKIIQRVAGIVSGFLVHKAAVDKKSSFFTRFLGRIGQVSITALVNKLLRKALPI